jgi:hypothetical protein
LSKNRNFEKKFVDAEMGVKIGKLPRKSGELAALADLSILLHAMLFFAHYICTRSLVSLPFGSCQPICSEVHFCQDCLAIVSAMWDV